MTATVEPCVCETPFDRALIAAIACGWTPRPAFDAVSCLLASGLAAEEIEWLFLDAAKRVQ